jgi:phage terminase small subunit
MEKLPILPNDTNGPAMKSLSPLQRKFVLEHLKTGGTNLSEAVQRAGYKGTAESWRAIGEDLLVNQKVLDAFREVADKRLQSGAILASSVLMEIAGNPMHKDQFKASKELLDRSGLIVEEVKRVIIEDHRSIEDIEKRISELATRLGLDAKALITDPKGKIEDATFTVVDDEFESMLK